MKFLAITVAASRRIAGPRAEGGWAFWEVMAASTEENTSLGLSGDGDEEGDEKKKIVRNEDTFKRPE